MDSMVGLEALGKILLPAGGVMVLVGLVLIFAGRFPFLGKLPGDISIVKDGFSFHFPPVTSLS